MQGENTMTLDLSILTTQASAAPYCIPSAGNRHMNLSVMSPSYRHITVIPSHHHQQD